MNFYCIISRGSGRIIFYCSRACNRAIRSSSRWSWIACDGLCRCCGSLSFLHVSSAWIAYHLFFWWDRSSPILGINQSGSRTQASCSWWRSKALSISLRISIHRSISHLEAANCSLLLSVLSTKARVMLSRCCRWTDAIFYRWLSQTLPALSHWSHHLSHTSQISSAVGRRYGFAVWEENLWWCRSITGLQMVTWSCIRRHRWNWRIIEVYYLRLLCILSCLVGIFDISWRIVRKIGRLSLFPIFGLCRCVRCVVIYLCRGAI